MNLDKVRYAADPADACLLARRYILAAGSAARFESRPAQPPYIRTERGAGYVLAVPVHTIY